MAANLMARSYENMAEKQLTASDAEAHDGQQCLRCARSSPIGRRGQDTTGIRVLQTGAKARQTDGTPVGDVTYVQTAAGVRIARLGSRRAGRLACRWPEWLIIGTWLNCPGRVAERQ